jgi:general secretion pathway protein I
MNHKLRIKNSELRETGFTLIEVIVALVIVSVSLAMVMQLFSAGLKASRASCDYTRAVIYAKDIMEEMSESPEQDSGAFDDGYSWETEVQPYVEDEGGMSNLLLIKVKVFWDDVLRNPKSIEIVSLKAVEDEEEL